MIRSQETDQEQGRSTRVFMGITKPLICAAAEWLIENLNAPEDRLHSEKSAAFINLKQVTCIVPSKRAGRRLLANLAFKAQRCALIPPTIITPGETPEVLLNYNRSKLIGTIEEQLIWLKVLSLAEDATSKLYNSFSKECSFNVKLSIANEISSLIQEIAGYGLQPEGIANYLNTSHYPGEDLWRNIADVYKCYQEELSKRGITDKNLARFEALKGSSQTFKQYSESLVLIGTLDLNLISKQAISSSSAEIFSLISGSEENKDGFDDYGSVIPSYWINKKINLSDNNIVYCANSSDAATRFYNYLKSSEESGETQKSGQLTLNLSQAGKIDPNDHVICCPLTESKSEIEKELSLHEIPTRDIDGTSLSLSSPLKLISIVGTWLSSRSRASLGELVRHPDIYNWLVERPSLSEIPSIVSAIDSFITESLPIDLFPINISNAPKFLSARTIIDQINLLLGALAQSTPLTLQESCQSILALLNSLYGERSLNPANITDKLTLDALTEISNLVNEILSIEQSQELLGSTQDLIGFLVSHLMSARVEPMTTEAAVEFRGWLEIALEEAPNLTIVGFNEALIPENRSADRFLPDHLRQVLNLPSNNSRYARDAAIVSGLINSYQTVRLMTLRTNRRGEPLLPSRLLLSDEKSVAQRMLAALNAREYILEEELDARLQDNRESLIFIPDKLRSISERAFSPTTFAAYVKCPFSCYLEKILYLDSQDDDSKELDPLQFGSMVHEVLCAWARDDNLISISNIEQLSKALLHLLTEYTERVFGKRPPATVLLQIAQAKSRLQDFAIFQVNHYKEGWRVKHTEHRLYGKIKGQKETVVISGIIDRVDYNINSNVTLALDYKTGAKQEDADKYHRTRSKGPFKRFQLPLYQELLKQNRTETEIKTALLIMNGDSETRLSTLNWDEDTFAANIKEAAEIGEAIIAQKFWPPSKSKDDSRTGEVVRYALGIYQVGSRT